MSAKKEMTAEAIQVVWRALEISSASAASSLEAVRWPPFTT